jgi:UDP-N-acetylglucosamine--N-acetylmuramyl-(pentapeptide) pyrophosphoryl-undecaprenol N-acetylglucosamine transferase
MSDALAVADIVLSRAGSNTLSELLALQKPMLLVPYPLGASRGDQIENAKSYARQGLARVLMQEDMTAQTMTEGLLKLLNEKDELLSALKAYPVKDGTDAVLKLIQDAQKK